VASFLSFQDDPQRRASRERREEERWIVEHPVHRSLLSFLLVVLYGAPWKVRRKKEPSFCAWGGAPETPRQACSCRIARDERHPRGGELASSNGPEQQWSTHQPVIFGIFRGPREGGDPLSYTPVIFSPFRTSERSRRAGHRSGKRAYCRAILGAAAGGLVTYSIAHSPKSAWACEKLRLVRVA
jgi:hypothetical protein